MPSPTWAELGTRKVTYVCRYGIEDLENCRAMIAHLRWIEQVEQWVLASIVGTAFLLLSLAVAMLLRSRPERAGFAVRPRLVAVGVAKQQHALVAPIAGVLAAA
jgi:hypothetical protein